MKCVHTVNSSPILAVLFLSIAVGASADGPKMVRLTEDGLFKQRPVWSPDGQWLGFCSASRFDDLFVLAIGGR